MQEQLQLHQSFQVDTMIVLSVSLVQRSYNFLMWIMSDKMKIYL
jgi:hypothetical protein